MDKSFLVGRVYQAEDIFLSEDDLNNPLGGGGFGVVVRAFTPKLGVVAVKCLDFTAGGTMPVEELIQKMPYEAKNMHMLNHTNIVRMHGFTTWPGYFGIIQDYMPVGNLESLLENTKPSLTMRLRIALDISNALCYLHGFDTVNKIVHGDIKPKNILLDDGLRAKLIDFGTIQIIAHTTTRKTLST
uniref:non-specific serine/threonine protein kinase n=1 Tax=Ciona savignyi TaxID=51511 RepID=H2YYS0_CIOSA